MCEQGVLQLARNLSGSSFAPLAKKDWLETGNGFTSGGYAVGLLFETCPACGEQVRILKRPFASGAYNLPDTAIYHRLRFGQPCIALGIVDEEKTTLGQDPDAKDPEIRPRWQGLLWHVYQVAFLDVGLDKKIGAFKPRKEWWVGPRPDNLPELADEFRSMLIEARDARKIEIPKPGPRGYSTPTAGEIERTLTPRLREPRYGYQLVGTEQWIDVFWWGRKIDILYRRRDDPKMALGIEVKVKEDWRLPLGQPLGTLPAHSAVVNIRVPLKEDRGPRDLEVRRCILRAEAILEGTGRAAFLSVDPAGE